VNTTFAQLDVDGSGVMDFEEFFQWWTSPEFQARNKDKIEVLMLKTQRFLRVFFGRTLKEEAARVMALKAKERSFEANVRKVRVLLCTVLNMHCTHYTLYSLYTVLTIHCTHYTLYSLYTILTTHCTR
jgi:hypothetical protein